jgi:hypothetical protein
MPSPVALDLPHLAPAHAAHPHVHHGNLCDAPRVAACLHRHGGGGSGGGSGAARAAAGGKAVHVVLEAGAPAAFVLSEPANHAGPRFGVVPVRDPPELVRGQGRGGRGVATRQSPRSARPKWPTRPGTHPLAGAPRCGARSGRDR